MSIRPQTSTNSAISRFDSETLQLKGSIGTVFGVRTLAVDPVRNLLLAGSLVSNMLDVIDLETRARVAKYYVGPWLRTIALDSAAGILCRVASEPQPAAIGTLLVGIGLGAEVDLIAFLLSRYLGMRSFGEIYGYFFAIFMLGAGLGPFAMGVSFDRTGSYKLMLVCFGLALAPASLMMLRFGPYAYPARPLR